MPRFIIIVAVDQNNIIGNKNSLPWPKIKEDLDHFKKTTLNHSIIMGRKTFESIGKNLPNRKNYVLSSQEIKNKEVLNLKNLEEAKNINEEIVYIIGGQKVYEQFLPLAEEIIMSRLPFSVKGDTFFPDIDKKDWQTIEKREVALSDFENKKMIIEKLIKKD